MCWHRSESQSTGVEGPAHSPPWQIQTLGFHRKMPEGRVAAGGCSPGCAACAPADWLGLPCAPPVGPNPTFVLSFYTGPLPPRWSQWLISARPPRGRPGPPAPSSVNRVSSRRWDWGAFPCTWCGDSRTPRRAWGSAGTVESGWGSRPASVLGPALLCAAGTPLPLGDGDEMPYPQLCGGNVVCLVMVIVSQENNLFRPARQDREL